MQKRDFETCQKRFRDFEILPKFSETHVFRGTIRHPLNGILARLSVIKLLNNRGKINRYPQDRDFSSG